MRLIDAEKLEQDIRDYADKKIMNPGYVEYANGIIASIGVVNLQPAVGQWIPVTERMPTNEFDVLVTVERTVINTLNQNIFRFVCRAFYQDGKKPVEESCYNWDSFYDTDLLEYDEENDVYLTPEGWYESLEYAEEQCAISDKVIAWQPLPEPYREVEK